MINFKKVARRFSKDTHHHYGAQQVGTLKVDPISVRIILDLTSDNPHYLRNPV